MYLFHDSGGVPALRLGGNDGILQLPEGPAYLFTTADQLNIIDTVTGDVGTAMSEDVIWLDAGSCVRLEVGSNEELQRDSGNVTILVVSSGAIDLTLNGNEFTSECTQSVMAIGLDDLHNNPIDYVASGWP